MNRTPLRRAFSWDGHLARPQGRAGRPSHVLLAALLAVGLAFAQEDQRSSLQVSTDEDGDVAVVMDTESIRMMLLPAYQGCVSSFIFKPTGNDILARQTVKHLLGGQGLLQDNFWEQDWRYSEFRHKWFDYKIVSQGPDELAAKFWTTSDGWLQAVKSGVISDLLSNIKIERTVRMPAGKPYFLCDVTLSIDLEKDKKGNAKMPQFWMHNMCIFTDELDEECQRPHTHGIAEETKDGRTVSGDYVYAPFIAEGWTAQTAPRSREGVVYLMDPAYVQCLYNCGNTTVEWFGDNMLITKDRPLRTRIYILPVIGLQKVHFADPHMIVQLAARNLQEGPDAGAFELDFAVSPSFRKVKSITFETWATYGLHERRPERVRMIDPQPVVRNLRVEAPRHARGLVKRPDNVALDEKTPLKLDITAHVEVMENDGRLKTRQVQFQYFHLGAYPTRQNAHLQGGEPLAVLDRVEAWPWIPQPDPGLQINRKDFRIFSLIGPHARHYRLPQSLAKVATAAGAAVQIRPDEDLGYTPGFTCSQMGLTQFPYDVRRLFDYRLVLNCNSQTDITRLVGQSILAGYLERGGGYVTFGGECGQAVGAPEGHPLNAYAPVVPSGRSIALREDAKPGRLVVTAPDHPVFKGNGKQARAIDLTRLPQALSWHTLPLKQSTLKPFLRDPRETCGLVLGALPADLQAAVQALPAARRRNRAEQVQHLYAQMPDDVRTHLTEACAATFKDLPADALKDGLFAEAQLVRVTDANKCDIRTAFIDYGDDERALVNTWMDANFARANPVRHDRLPPELQQGLTDLLKTALAGEGGFVLHNDLLLLPEDCQARLFALLALKADELPRTTRPRVLMEVAAPDGTNYPFLVEVAMMKDDPASPDKLIPNPEGGRALAFLNTPFGDKEKFPAGTLPYWEWDQWEQLVANVLMYAGREL